MAGSSAIQNSSAHIATADRRHAVEGASLFISCKNRESTVCVLRPPTGHRLSNVVRLPLYNSAHAGRNNSRPSATPPFRGWRLISRGKPSVLAHAAAIRSSQSTARIASYRASKNCFPKSAEQAQICWSKPIDQPSCATSALPRGDSSQQDRRVDNQRHLASVSESAIRSVFCLS